MIRIIGVRFRTAGKLYYFGIGEENPHLGDLVVVETSRGQEIGRIVMEPHEIEESETPQPVKPILRLASQSDIERIEKNKEREKEAFRVCQEKIRSHNLEMKLVRAEYTFDNSKLLFYFTADGRVDFRELVKDLASVFHTRIELRQIGVRDETKMMGGLGICGRPLCCTTYLADFSPVSIKMAKEQNLSLNPTKISGLCGRLMCCLNNEQETYEYLNAQMPRIGDTVSTPEGIHGEVKAINVMRQRVKVLFEQDDTKEERDYPVEEIEVIAHRAKGGKNNGKSEQAKNEAVGDAQGKKRDRANGGGREDKHNREHRSNREEQHGQVDAAGEGAQEVSHENAHGAKDGGKKNGKRNRNRNRNRNRGNRENGKGEAPQK